MNVILVVGLFLAVLCVLFGVIAVAIQVTKTIRKKQNAKKTSHAVFYDSEGNEKRIEW